ATEAQHAHAMLQQESEHDGLNQRIYELDATIKQNQNHLNLTALEVDRSENRIAFNRQRSAELAGRNDQITQEIAGLSSQTAEWEIRNSEQHRSVVSLRVESGSLGTRVVELSEQAAARSTQIHDSEMRIEALRQRA